VVLSAVQPIIDLSGAYWGCAHSAGFTSIKGLKALATTCKGKKKNLCETTEEIFY